jgi:REP element-mobilizing transposase RayT
MAAGGKGSGPDCARGCAGPATSVTQRGNRREPVLFGAGDYQLYRQLIAAAARHAGAEISAYCLMPNHVHLIVTPTNQDGLRATFAEAHRRYTGAINARFQWTGHLFQGRFGAVVMDEPQPAGGNALHRAQSGGRGW